MVCRTLLASAKPIPREAGEIMDHGGIVIAAKCQLYEPSSQCLDTTHLELQCHGRSAIDDDILALSIELGQSGI